MIWKVPATMRSSTSLVEEVLRIEGLKLHRKRPNKKEPEPRKNAGQKGAALGRENKSSYQGKRKQQRKEEFYRQRHRERNSGPRREDRTSSPRRKERTASPGGRSSSSASKRGRSTSQEGTSQREEDRRAIAEASCVIAKLLKRLDQKSEDGEEPEH